MFFRNLKVFRLTGLLLGLEERLPRGAWRTGARGPITPIYHWGPGEDAEKPKPLSSGEKCSRYRAAMAAKHGENYPLIRKAQRKNVPGRKIVVEGKAIYEQAPR